MTDGKLRVEECRIADTFVGWRISAGQDTVLVWNDQQAMPGIRCGAHFVPGIGKEAQYSDALNTRAPSSDDAKRLREIAKAHDRSMNGWESIFLRELANRLDTSTPSTRREDMSIEEPKRGSYEELEQHMKDQAGFTGGHDL